MLGGFPVKEIYATKEYLGVNDIKHGISCFEISQKDLEAISTLKNPNQVLAVCHARDMSLTDDDIEKITRQRLVIYLDGIRDPGNLGTIIRTANWFGIKHIFCSPDTVEVYNPKVIQATMGALVSTNVISIDLPIFFNEISNTVPVYGLFLEGDKIHNISKKKNGIIIIGSESHGIREKAEKYVTQRINIPPYDPENPHTESLNASIAASIAMFYFSLT